MAEAVSPEDASRRVNPFQKAGKGKKAEGNVQHTIKYCIWELLNEHPNGLSVDHLWRQMESRGLRSFANCSRPASQISGDISRAKQYFVQDKDSKMWKLRDNDYEARAQPNEAAVEESARHGAAAVQPVSQQEDGAAAALPQSPVAGLKKPGSQAVPPALAGTSIPSAVLDREQQERPAAVVPQAAAAFPDLGAQCTGTAVVSQAAPVSRQRQKGSSQPAEPEPSKQAKQPPAGSSLADGPASIPSSCQPSGTAEPCGSGARPGRVEAQPKDAGAQAAAAMSPRFILSPTTGVAQAIHSSPASPVSDIDVPVFSSHMASAAQPGKAEGMPQPGSSKAHQVSKEQTPTVVDLGAAPTLTASTVTLEEEFRQSSTSASTHAGSGDGTAESAAQGELPAGVQAALARGLLSRDNTAVEKSCEDIFGTSSPVDAMDASLRENVAVRWMAIPEWTNPWDADGPLDSDAGTAPLLGTLPLWPFPTLFPPTPERPAPTMLQMLEEAQPPLPQAPPREQPPWPPDLTAAPSRAPLLAPASSMQPVSLLEDGEPPLPGTAAAHPAGVPLPAGSSMTPAAPELAPATAPARHTLLRHWPSTLPQLECGPYPQLPAMTKDSTLVGGTGAAETRALAGSEPLSRAASDRRAESAEAVPAAAKQGPQQHLISAPVLERSSSERGPGGDRERPSDRDRDGSNRPHDRDGRGGSRQRDAGDEADRPHKRDRGAERRDSAREEEAPRKRKREYAEHKWEDRHGRGSTPDDRHWRSGKGDYRDKHRDDQRDDYRDTRRGSTLDDSHPGKDDHRDEHREKHRDDYKDDCKDEYRDSRRGRAHEEGRHHPGKDDRRNDHREKHRDGYKDGYRDSREGSIRDDKEKYRDSSREDYRESRRRDSRDERREESGRGRREGSRQRDKPREEAHRSQGRDAMREGERDREEDCGLNRHGSKQQSRSRSGTRDSASPDHDWPFDLGRIICVSKSTEADCFLRLAFGSDVRKDLEGIDGRTAVFVWNYDSERLHGIFAGGSSGVQETKSKHDPFLYEVAVKNYADYRSLSVDTVRRIVPSSGHTHKGKKLLLQTRIDRGQVVKLCREFARKR